MRRNAYLAAIVTTVFAAAGCNLGNDVDTEDPLNFDAAVVAAEGAVEDLEMMHGPGLGLRGVVFPGLLGNRPDCPMTEDIFMCDPIEREGITYTRIITYRDAAGNTQSAYDESTTASIEYQISVQGDKSREGWSATIMRDRNLVVTGLLDGTGQVMWNGSGSGDVARSRHFDDGAERSYNITSTSDVSDVVIAYPREDDSWPLSGTITRALTMTRVSDGDSETGQRDVSLEFNGTSEVPITVDGETFTVDLSQRRFGPRNLRGGPGH